MFSRPSRRSKRQAEGSTKPRRATYANVTATLALVIALGGGTAWAAHHYIITSTKQIKPSVLSSLKKPGLSGAAGPAGPAGAQGAAGPAGATGGQGVQGPQGPGAISFVVNGLGATDQSPASGGDGPIPVYFYCTGTDGQLFTTATDGGTIEDPHDGTYATTWDDGANNGDVDSPALQYQWSGGFGSSGDTQIATGYSSTSDIAIGTTLLEDTSGNFLFPSVVTETINWQITENGTTCSLAAQIVPS